MQDTTRHRRGKDRSGELGDAAVFDQAAAFLAWASKRPEPWPQAFEKWARSKSLSESDQRAIRIAVLRARVFGAGVRGGRRRVDRGGGEAA